MGSKVLFRRGGRPWLRPDSQGSRAWWVDRPPTLPLRRLVQIAKSRWKIEQDYLQFKEELGLDHYKGRNWAGWHHHVSVVLACYAFLVAHNVRSFPPSARTQDADHPVRHAA